MDLLSRDISSRSKPQSGEKIVKNLFLMAAILAAFPLLGQEVKHAPTKDVCQADVAVWYSTEMSTEYSNAEAAWMSDHIPNRTALGKMSVREALARMGEMYTCEEVDAAQSDLYHKAGNLYFGIYTDRALSFLSRHNLMKQFQQEDDAGKR
jgi:hypothetical protein